MPIKTGLPAAPPPVPSCTRPAPPVARAHPPSTSDSSTGLRSRPCTGERAWTGRWLQGRRGGAETGGRRAEPAGARRVPPAEVYPSCPGEGGIRERPARRGATGGGDGNERWASARRGGGLRGGAAAPGPPGTGHRHGVALPGDHDVPVRPVAAAGRRRAGGRRGGAARPGGGAVDVTAGRPDLRRPVHPVRVRPAGLLRRRRRPRAAAADRPDVAERRHGDVPADRPAAADDGGVAVALAVAPGAGQAGHARTAPFLAAGRRRTGGRGPAWARRPAGPRPTLPRDTGRPVTRTRA